MQNINVDQHILLAYIANLELEVDRLRKQSQFVQHEAIETLKQIQTLCAHEEQLERVREQLTEIGRISTGFATVLRDLREPSGYHPAHDQVIAIAVRPLVERVFRWQQRLMKAPDIVLRLQLESDYIEWFPSRLRHIFDNLISNAVKYRDLEKGETRMTLALRILPGAYEFQLSDNGLGMNLEQSAESLELFFRSAPTRAAGLGVGLAVAKLLVEQSGGTLTMTSGEGQGTSIVAILPRFDVEDFLENSAVNSSLSPDQPSDAR